MKEVDGESRTLLCAYASLGPEIVERLLK
jgi:hypothetical protein